MRISFSWPWERFYEYRADSFCHHKLIVIAVLARYPDSAVCGIDSLPLQISCLLSHVWWGVFIDSLQVKDGETLRTYQHSHYVKKLWNVVRERSFVSKHFHPVLALTFHPNREKWWSDWFQNGLCENATGWHWAEKTRLLHHLFCHSKLVMLLNHGVVRGIGLTATQTLMQNFTYFIYCMNLTLLFKEKKQLNLTKNALNVLSTNWLVKLVIDGFFKEQWHCYVRG